MAESPGDPQAPDDIRLDQLPQAEVVPHRSRLHLTAIWLLPLLAVLIGGWLVYQDYASRGPLIDVRFDNAAGIEAKKTRVKYRDVNVGLVEEVRFSGDLGQVVVSLRLDNAFENRVTEATRFWVVRPRIEGLRISGLETLISGAYITMDLGQGGSRKREFVGLEEPRSILSDTPGSFYTLISPELGALTPGAPVYYRDIVVGEIVNYRLERDPDQVAIEFFVQAPHDEHVRANTRFWNVSGFNVDLNAKGLKLGIQSLAALISGGIAFGIEEGARSQPKAADGAEFVLYASREASREAPITIVQKYTLYFDDTVRGLSVGAPVEYRGLRVGTVTNIVVDNADGLGPLWTPVTIALEPERLPMSEKDRDRAASMSTEEKLQRVHELIERSVDLGLRARLETGNLLTGQLLVSLDYVDEPDPAEIIYEGKYPQLPTVPSTFRGMTQSLSRILSKLERLPLEEIGRNLNETVAGANRLVNDEHLRSAVVKMDEALERLNQVLDVFAKRSGPVMQSVEAASRDVLGLIEATEKAVARAESALLTIEKSVSDDGPMGREIMTTLRELSEAARSIRIMADYLERHPEALIKGKPDY